MKAVRVGGIPGEVTEPSRCCSCSVPIRRTFRNDSDARLALTQLVTESSHLALQFVDEFADACVVR